MAGLRVSELAARAGVPPSTVRFYERAGLLAAARRADNGYRLFDESAVEDLSLIGRAKNAGMSLEEAADLVAAWHDSPCHALRDRLQAHLHTELGRTDERITDLTAFRRKLEESLDRLAARDSGGDAGRCGPGCRCDDALSAGATPPGEARGVSSCSLDEAGLTGRMAQWRVLAASAQEAERDGDTVRLTLNPAMLPSAAALIAAEADCCPQARFTLEATAGLVFLVAKFPNLLHPSCPYLSHDRPHHDHPAQGGCVSLWSL